MRECSLSGIDGKLNILLGTLSDVTNDGFISRVDDRDGGLLDTVNEEVLNKELGLEISGLEGCHF